MVCPVFNGAHPSTVIFLPAGASSPAVATGAPGLTLALTAERSISLPSPVIHLDPSQYSVTGLPTWMWIDSSVWHGYSATASAGGITATARAIPSSVQWAMGDGTEVVCNGPGVPFRPDEPAGAQQTYCAHTYNHTSLGQPSADGNPDHGAYTVIATITWVVTWTTNEPGLGGALPPLSTEASTLVRVEQVQSARESG
jgi:hypothetical protein